MVQEKVGCARACAEENQILHKADQASANCLAQGVQFGEHMPALTSRTLAP